MNQIKQPAEQNQRNRFNATQGGPAHGPGCGAGDCDGVRAGAKVNRFSTTDSGMALNGPLYINLNCKPDDKCYSLFLLISFR